MVATKVNTGMNMYFMQGQRSRHHGFASRMLFSWRLRVTQIVTAFRFLSLANNKKNSKHFFFGDSSEKKQNSSRLFYDLFFFSIRNFTDFPRFYQLQHSDVLQ